MKFLDHKPFLSGGNWLHLISHGTHCKSSSFYTPSFPNQ